MKKKQKTEVENERELSHQKTKEEIESNQIKETKDFTQHEDTALKVAAQYFGEGLLEFFGIEGKIVKHIATESVYVEVRRMLEDFNFEMEDGSIIHFEFQSKNGGISDLRRFRSYEAVSGEKEKTPVITYVLYSGNIKHPITELNEGINTYRVIPLMMKNYKAEQYLEEIHQKIQNNQVLDKKDFVTLALIPIMNGEIPQKERILKALQLLKSARNVDDVMIKKTEAVIYIMAKYSLQGTTQGRYLTGGVPPVRFSM